MKTLLQYIFILSIYCVITTQLFGQTNPVAQSLPYTQNWGTSQFATMPAGTAAWNPTFQSTQAGAEASAPGVDKAMGTSKTASTTAGGVYSYLPSGTNVRLYMQDLSTSSFQLATAINTGSYTGFNISYTIEAVNIGSGRLMGVVLQYRAGITGTWTTVTGSAVSYSNTSANGGTTDIAGNIDSYSYSVTGLTASTVYQIRWATWVSGAANTAGVAFDDISITGTGGGSGVITTNTSSFTGAFGNAAVGTSSSSSSFTVAGTGLTNNITVTPPTGFEIRTGANAFSTSAVILTQIAGVVNTTTIDARFTPLTAAAFSANITCVSSGATTQNVAVSGNSVGSITTNIVGFTGGFGNAAVGTSTASSSFTVSGTNLSNNITVTPPTGFEIRTGVNAFSTSAVTLTPTAGVVTATTIDARFAPLTAAAYSANIVCASTGATSQNVAVSGNSLGSITTNIVGFTGAFGSAIIGASSSSSSFTVAGSNLTNNIIVTPPTGFEIRTGSDAFSTTPVTLTQSSGVVNATTIDARFTPLTAAAFSANIVCSSTGATSANVAVSGSSVGTITLNVSSFTGAFGYAKVGNSSSSSSFTVSGSNLSYDVVVTPPTGFEIRTGSNAFSTSAVNLTPVSGVLSAATIDARFTPLTSASFSGNISSTSTGATTQNTAVSGNSLVTSIVTGNWSSTSTWNSGQVPLSTDNVLIATNDTVTVDDANATCQDITFGSATAHLAMGSAGSVLNIYGNFTLFSTTHAAFTAWPAGAKIKFTGSSAAQTLSGWPTASPTVGGFNEIIVDKSAGKVVTAGNNMKIGIGTSLEVVNGIFEVATTDDIYGLDIAVVATATTIMVRSGATFRIVIGATQINKGTSATGYNPIGKMTVYGTAEFTTTSSNKMAIGGIDVESGGVLRLLTGWSVTTAGEFCPGIITVKSGGTFENNNSSALTIWSVLAGGAASLVLESGSTAILNSTVNTLALPLAASLTDNGCTFKYPLAGAQTGIYPKTYTNLELGGSGIKTLGGAITVNGTLSITGTASLALGAGSLTYGASSTLEYGNSSQSSAQTTTDAELPASGGPHNLIAYNSGGVTLHASRTINGNVTVTSGDLTTGANTLTLGSTATLSETSANIVVGNMATTRTVAQGVQNTFGNIGVEIKDDNNALGSTSVTRVTGTVLSNNSNSSISRYYVITPTVNTNLNSTLVFHYCDRSSELNSIAEANLKLWRSTDAGVDWTFGDMGVDDEVANTVTLTGIADFSEWTLGNENAPLPVELTSFSGKLVSDKIQLNWRTATEVNNFGFEIERSINGSFSKIGFVKGNGNSNSPKSYSFTDAKISQDGKHIYRLKQIDESGEYKYSPAISIDVNIMPKQFKIAQNYPNPFNPSTSISVAIPSESKVRISVYSAIGKEVSVLTDGIMQTGYQTINWNASSFPSGLYYYTIEAKSIDGKNSFKETKKMVLVK